MVSRWSLSDSKSSQFSGTHLNTLADLTNAVVWIVFTRPLISKSSSSCTNPLVTVPKAPITIGITVTFTFHNFFNSLTRPRYLFFFLLSFNFTLWLARTAKSTIQLVLFFFSWLFLGLIVGPRFSDPFCILKSQRSLYVSFFKTNSGLWIYHLFVRSNFNFLLNSEWITLPTQSCLVLCSLC